ncbi:MAG: hypothetical protein GX608_04710, partial [Lentisphaerae bacterium]|nr:hypothetical protein [Lentisphaerota bacterium]
MAESYAMRIPQPTSLRRLSGAAAAAIVLSAARSVLADGFDLRVNDVSGLDEPWPLVAGLPFPEGALRDASAIRIVGADGAEVPAQVDAVATWRDGSLQWALAGFTARPQAAFRVEYGLGVRRMEPPVPLRIEQASDGPLTVNTGAAVFTFRPGRLLPDRAAMGTAVVLDGAGAGAYLVDNRGREARVVGAAAEVESDVVLAGPARAVIRRAGWYVTETGERLARAEAWFYFAAGCPSLRIT